MITRSEDQHSQFRSVEANFAIIETASFCSRYKKAASLIDHRLDVDEDKSHVESDVILCQMDDRFYRLLLRVKSKTHWRIVDPSDALSAIIRMLPSTTCQHRDEPPEMSPSLTAKIYTMDEVLGRCRAELVSTTTATQTSGIVHLTHVLDTHLKKNIALALSVCPIAVQNYPEFVCPTCTLGYVRRAERKSLREGESGNPADRYIINLRTRLAGQDSAMRRVLIEGSNIPTEDGLSTR